MENGNEKKRPTAEELAAIEIPEEILEKISGGDRDWSYFTCPKCHNTDWGYQDLKTGEVMCLHCLYIGQLIS